MWKSIKSVFSSAPDYETDTLDIFMKAITDFGDDPGEERLQEALKQAIDTFNKLHESQTVVLSKESGDGIVKFLLESAEFMGPPKGYEKYLEMWRKF